MKVVLFHPHKDKLELRSSLDESLFGCASRGCASEASMLHVSPAHRSLRNLRRAAAALRLLRSVERAEAAAGVNIGYATALKLLRLGATVAVTSRFPRDCLRRYSQEEERRNRRNRRNRRSMAQISGPCPWWRSWEKSWRLDAGRGLVDSKAAAFPRLDLLINNAAQTVRRPASHYAQLLQLERTPLEERLDAWRCLVLLGAAWWPKGEAMAMGRQLWVQPWVPYIKPY
eukprot:Skav226899  [mRNA]  locus=scaffold2258:202972:207672:- [translate_table: standard]